MEKPIFETEEEAEEFFRTGVYYSVHESFMEAHDETMRIMKQHGYIKKSLLENARQDYAETMKTVKDTDESKNYIYFLEKEIKRLKQSF